VAAFNNDSGGGAPTNHATTLMAGSKSEGIRRQVLGSLRRRNPQTRRYRDHNHVPAQVDPPFHPAAGAAPESVLHQVKRVGPQYQNTSRRVNKSTVVLFCGLGNGNVIWFCSRESRFTLVTRNGLNPSPKVRGSSIAVDGNGVSDPADHTEDT
jgi:hypothetical protein